MQDMRGTIIHLQICVAHKKPMQAQASLQAVADLGLAGDLHAKPASTRQVLFMDEETLGKFGLERGRVRENITTRGIVLNTLVAGTRLRVGQAVFEIAKPCTPCEFIEAIRPGLRAEMEGQRGMLARVIEGGELRVGDVIEVE
jgi:MOSC domain-containing protein YiiM